jgi:hypothetical protein
VLLLVVLLLVADAVHNKSITFILQLYCDFQSAGFYG